MISRGGLSVKYFPFDRIEVVDVTDVFGVVDKESIDPIVETDVAHPGRDEICGCAVIGVAVNFDECARPRERVGRAVSRGRSRGDRTGDVEDEAGIAGEPRRDDEVEHIGPFGVGVDAGAADRGVARRG